jgi:hypothetical protein
LVDSDDEFFELPLLLLIRPNATLVQRERRDQLFPEKSRERAVLGGGREIARRDMEAIANQGLANFLKHFFGSDLGKVDLRVPNYIEEDREVASLDRKELANLAESQVDVIIL